MNMAFLNYVDDLIDSLDDPILQNWLTHEQIIPISLKSFDFRFIKGTKNVEGLCAPVSAKLFFVFQKRHNDNDLDSNKNSFF